MYSHKLGLSFLLSFIALSGCGSQSSPSDDSTEILPLIREFADILRVNTNSPLLDDPALVSVTSEYGPSVVATGPFPMKSGVAVASVKAWSSWWFPKKDDFLFNDPTGRHLSTLEKYDVVRRSRNSHLGSAADFERKGYNKNVKAWEGLCDAWSLAAIAVPEPRRAVDIIIDKRRGTKVTFEVGDIKALVLKTFEAVDDQSLKYYGQRFSGDFKGWIYPDIYPEQFHRFVEVQLFEKKLPFVMDHDAGVEVWNVPVHKANYTIDVMADNPNALFVRMWLYSAEAVLANEKNFVGTREAVREYNYVLLGTRDGSGNLVINSGYWIKGPDGIDSRQTHPDYLIKLPAAGGLERKSWNPEIDLDLVQEILNLSI